jgi:hypothetical protein
VDKRGAVCDASKIAQNLRFLCLIIGSSFTLFIKLIQRFFSKAQKA